MKFSSTGCSTELRNIVKARLVLTVMLLSSVGEEFFNLLIAVLMAVMPHQSSGDILVPILTLI